MTPPDLESAASAVASTQTQTQAQTPPAPATTEDPAPKPKPASKRKPKAAPAPQGISARLWALGDAVLAVPLAGLLASDPELRSAELPPEEWQKRLDEYRASKRG